MEMQERVKDRRDALADHTGRRETEGLGTRWRQSERRVFKVSVLKNSLQRR